MGLGFAIQTAFRQRPGEDLRRASIRTGGYWLSAGAFAGLTVTALRGGRRRPRLAPPPRLPGLAVGKRPCWRAGQRAPSLPGSQVPAEVDDRAVRPAGGGHRPRDRGRRGRVRTLGPGAVAAGRLARLLSRYLPGTESEWRPLGHVAVLCRERATASPCLCTRSTRSSRRARSAWSPSSPNPPSSPAISGSPGKPGAMGDPVGAGAPHHLHLPAPGVDRGRDGRARRRPNPSASSWAWTARRQRRRRVELALRETGTDRGLRSLAAHGYLPHRHRLHQLRRGRVGRVHEPR